MDWHMRAYICGVCQERDQAYFLFDFPESRVLRRQWLEQLELNGELEAHIRSQLSLGRKIQLCDKHFGNEALYLDSESNIRVNEIVGPRPVRDLISSAKQSGSDPKNNATISSASSRKHSAFPRHCEACNYLAISRHRLYRHLLSSPVCEQICERVRSASVDWRLPEPGKFICEEPGCSFNCAVRRTFVQHRKRHLLKRLGICDSVQHKKLARPVKPGKYKCKEPGCSFNCAARSTFRDHRLKHARSRIAEKAVLKDDQGNTWSIKDFCDQIIVSKPLMSGARLRSGDSSTTIPSSGSEG
ncbi:hypothetical protein AB6A40_007559 [Gnathostoma spinigerum]|uniref:THAP-type domain-containing protein n=1 Tax=Gnathostoma spinigerum TaxID=75299 RepID=A0ABD6EX65_9BILA